jgi:deazaflavin-dependent oxidoreductase (nitroreductase family)
VPASFAVGRSAGLFLLTSAVGVTPLVNLEDSERWVIFASKGGAPVNPGCYWNLKTEPNVSIEVGNEEIQVVATEATGAERDQLFDRQKAEAPQFAEYQAKTARSR